MHTKNGFSLVPVPGYLPSSNDLATYKQIRFLFQIKVFQTE